MLEDEVLCIEEGGDNVAEELGFDDLDDLKDQLGNICGNNYDSAEAVEHLWNTINNHGLHYEADLVNWLDHEGCGDHAEPATNDNDTIKAFLRKLEGKGILFVNNDLEEFSFKNLMDIADEREAAKVPDLLTGLRATDGGYLWKLQKDVLFPKTDGEFGLNGCPDGVRVEVGFGAQPQNPCWTGNVVYVMKEGSLVNEATDQLMGRGVPVVEKWRWLPSAGLKPSGQRPCLPDGKLFQDGEWLEMFWDEGSCPGRGNGTACFYQPGTGKSLGSDLCSWSTDMALSTNWLWEVVSPDRAKELQARLDEFEAGR